MNKKLLIYLICALLILWLVINLIGVSVDCFPTIGPRPVLRQIVESLFRTKCVTF
ncbi:hypothetical protein HY502_00005 [Candidatus Woesebacteria bacterium]|nr:hypothetical protein [Candidatus Woesebacteria bacterium]